MVIGAARVNCARVRWYPYNGAVAAGFRRQFWPGEGVGRTVWRHQWCFRSCGRTCWPYRCRAGDGGENGITWVLSAWGP